MIFTTLFFYDASSPLIGATVALYALFLIIALVQSGQAVMVMSNSVNASRRGIFGTLFGGAVCFVTADVFHIAAIGIKSANLDDVRRVIFALDYLPRMASLFLVYLSVFLATYNRVAIYVSPTSQLWFFKKIGDGVLLALWGVLFLAEVGQTLNPGSVTANPSSLHSATSSFFVIMNIASIVGILMLNRASNFQSAQDFVVSTLFRWLLPVMAFRAIWTTITTIIDNFIGGFKSFEQVHGYYLADVIFEQSSLAIMIGVMIRLGFQHAFWDIPNGVTPPFQPYRGQGKLGGMTVLIGPNGFPVLGPNGQPIYVPVSVPVSDHESAAPSLESWKHHSAYSYAPVHVSPNFMPAYQQQNLLPYGQSVVQHQRFVAPQRQHAHAPLEPVGYSYQPVGSSPRGSRLELF